MPKDYNTEKELLHTMICSLEKPFCIYGAGIVASSIYTAIRDLYHKKPIFFLVSDAEEGKRDDNPVEIDGIAVKRMSKWRQELQDNKAEFILPEKYLIATPQMHHDSIISTLHSLDNLKIENSQIFLFISTLENELMEVYYDVCHNHSTLRRIILQGEQSEKEVGRAGVKNTIQVFQAKSHKDRLLQNPKKGFGQNICPIQVGAGLTDQIISSFQDNIGDNISTKNPNYSELTATYYVWKNSHAAYKGICHYRRIFDISEAQMDKLLEMEQDWDVILPYPSIHYPNIERQHIRYLKETDWNAMLQALGETAPDYMRAYEQMLLSDEQHFYNYNMLIAKAEVFDDYCSFLFKVLERAEALTTPKGWERADRFAGYMGENLTTIYFLKNKDKLKIAYAGKLWLT